MHGTWKTTGPGRGTWQTSDGPGPVVASAAAILACYVVLQVILDLAWVIAAVAAAAAVGAVVSVPLVRCSARRLSPARRYVAGREVPLRTAKALPAPRLAIEAPKPAVQGVIVEQEVRNASRH